ncbi:MAG: LEA type 2 family protein [Burkholderiales bacterium]
MIALRHLPAALALCAGIACAQNATVNVASVRIDRVTSTEADFAVTLVVENKDANELSMDDARAELKVEDVNVGRAKLTEPLRVPPGGKGTARLVAHADWNAALRIAFQAAKRAEADPATDPSVRYTVSGVAYVFGGLPVPFSRNGEFAWPRTITVR